MDDCTPLHRYGAGKWVATILLIAFKRHRNWYGGLIERLFGLSKAEVNEKVFLLLGIYKIGVFLVFMIPSIALRMAP